jgi:hypothetical protein
MGGGLAMRERTVDRSDALGASIEKGKSWILEVFDHLAADEGGAFKRRWLGDEFASIRERDRARVGRTLEIFHGEESYEVAFSEGELTLACEPRNSATRSRLERRLSATLKKIKG